MSSGCVESCDVQRTVRSFSFGVVTVIWPFGYLTRIRSRDPVASAYLYASYSPWVAVDTARLTLSSQEEELLRSGSATGLSTPPYVTRSRTKSPTRRRRKRNPPTHSDTQDRTATHRGQHTLADARTSAYIVHIMRHRAALSPPRHIRFMHPLPHPSRMASVPRGSLEG